MTSECFEQDYGDIKDDEWSNHEVLIRKRLSNMPKTTPECDRVIALENTYVHNMRKLGYLVYAMMLQNTQAMNR